MNNLICIYWAPGSCGDIIQNIIKEKFNIFWSNELDSNGKSKPHVDPALKSMFPDREKNGWHHRVWSDTDLMNLDLLVSSNNQPCVIGTHSLVEIAKIKHAIPKTITIGINYDKFLYPAVIKNWALKISTSPQMIDSYRNSHGVIVDKFLEKNIFSEFVFKNQLSFGNINDRIPKFVDGNFDVNLTLANILNNDLHEIDDFLSASGKEIFTTWHLVQNKLYMKKFDCNEQYAEAVGFNYQSTEECHDDIPFSQFDNILVEFYCDQLKMPRPKTKLTTNTDAVIFFKSIT
jgi:hypothetical protein